MAHPRMYDDASPAIRRLRALCLALPDAFEKEAWGECTFRVTGGSMFAMTDNDHHGSGRVSVWIKAPPMVQEILTHADPDRFFVPPYVGPKGWVGVRLDYKVDWDELAAILRDGYLLSAPKRLRARIADEPPPVATARGRGSTPKKRSAAAPATRSKTRSTRKRSAS